MSQSGAGLDPQVIPTFEKLRARDLKYIIYKMSKDCTKIEVDTFLKKEDIPAVPDDTSEDIEKWSPYKRFLHVLPEYECRYGVYDLEYALNPTDGARSKICLVNWSHDKASVRAKMVYASSKEALRRSLTAVALDIQACDYSEVAEEVLLEKAKQRK